jgi:perosamine synthetase
MMNLPAAIGLAQMEKIDWHLGRRLEVATRYRERLRGETRVTWQAEREWATHVYWMFTVVLGEEVRREADDVMSRLAESGIETRPVFYPIHLLPPYRNAAGGEFPVAERLARRGISLPTWAGLGREEVDYVCDMLVACLSEP